MRNIREFRLDSVDDYSVGQELKVGEMFAEGELVDVTGSQQGPGLRGHREAPQFSRGPEDPRLRQLSQAGLDRPGHDARACLKGLKMGGHMGHERVTSRSCASSAWTPSAT